MENRGFLGLIVAVLLLGGVYLFLQFEGGDGAEDVGGGDDSTETVSLGAKPSETLT